MSGLLKDNWIVLYASAFNPLQYVVWVEEMKKIWPPTNLQLKKENIFQ